MVNANMQLVLEALRSRKYRQTKGQLAHTDLKGANISYCCLGIMCKVYQESKGDLDMKQGSNGLYYEEHYTDLPVKVKEWLNLRDALGTYETSSLARNNDRGLRFSVIADIIESNPKGLFNEED